MGTLFASIWRPAFDDVSNQVLIMGGAGGKVMYPQSLMNVIPDAEMVLKLEPEELAEACLSGGTEPA